MRTIKAETFILLKTKWLALSARNHEWKESFKDELMVERSRASRLLVQRLVVTIADAESDKWTPSKEQKSCLRPEEGKENNTDELPISFRCLEKSSSVSVYPSLSALKFEEK